MSATRAERARFAIFAGLAVAILVAVGVYVVIRARAAQKPEATAADPRDAEARAALGRAPHVLFRSLELEPPDAFGHLEGSAIPSVGGARLDTGTPCMRVHFARRPAGEAARGLCFEADGAPDEHGSRAVLRGLDATWHPTWSRPMNGIPSRVRVSPHGKLGAATVFVTGHSYDDTTMSTQTLLVDMATGEVIADLEAFDLRRGDTDEKLTDGVNLWGVTFAGDDDTFYVTAARGASTWLAKGNASSRSLRTLREGVECPSLSPDERTIAFKKRGADRTDVRLFTLDVASLVVHAPAPADRPIPGEARVIDDQAEWLDARTILYKHGPDVWAASIDEPATPRVFLERAASPSVVEPEGGK